MSSTGQPVKLSRPLDYLVVTDHSDLMGIATDIQNGTPNIVEDPKGKEWADGFALFLLVPNRRSLIWAITAFTISHSITLALAAVGWLSVPTPPVEAIIALSIAFLAVEIVTKNSGQKTMMQRYPWLVAFAFGLLHGLGFASALKEIGLPNSEILIALLAFNLGIEAGQLMFVTCLIVITFIIKKMRSVKVFPEAIIGQTGNSLAGYMIGSIAAYWTIERVATFFV